MSIHNEGFWEWDLISDRFYLSGFCREFTGYSTDDAFSGTSFLTAVIYPDDLQEFFDAVRYRSSSTSDVSTIGIRLLTSSGDIQWAECRSSVLGYDENGNATRIVGRLVIPEMPGKTERELHTLNKALLAISSCNHALLRAGNEVELLNDICRIVVEIGGYRMAWVGYAQNDPEKSVHPVAIYGYDEGYVDKLGITWKDVDRGRGPTGTAIRTGEPNAVCNFQNAPGLVSIWKKEAAKRGYISILGLPLKTEQKVFGALTIYSGIESAFNDEEVELLSSLADNLSYSITMLRNRNAKNAAEAAMRQSEARYRSLFENHYTVMLIIDPEDGSTIDANPAAMDYYGWSRAKLCSMNIKQIDILLRIDPSCRNIFADPSKIHQVIINICTNAYQAMETSGGVLGIELNEIIPDSNLMNRYPELNGQPYAELTISDTGHGMDKITLNHIFDPFFTTKPVNKGTGLGLSVVHGIINEYDGVIDVESTPGKGCAFHIYLPVSNETISEVKQAVVAANRTASILLVDDELATTNFMTRLLEEQGYRIRAFNAPSRALEYFRKAPEAFDLVITDLTMPEMTGIRLVFEIHAIRPEIPVIMMTGYGKDIDNVENLGKQGIRHLLKKPVKLATLVSAINNVFSST